MELKDQQESRTEGFRGSNKNHEGSKYLLFSWALLQSAVPKWGLVRGLNQPTGSLCWLTLSSTLWLAHRQWDHKDFHFPGKHTRS